MLSGFLYIGKAELIVTTVIFVLLFIKIFGASWTKKSLLNLVNILLFISLIAGFFRIPTGQLFGSMYRTNELVTFEKNLLTFGTLIISLQAYPWLKSHQHICEFYMLLLCTLLGMFFMISSGNLLMFYLGLELSTIPLAALCNFDLEQRRSSEAALKMIISSAFSSGLLLFGISLIYGATGTLDYLELGAALHGSSLVVFSFILFFAGLGFKISAVPFHLWTADVYEGAPVAVTSYLSVVSKGALLFVIVTVFYSVFPKLASVWYNLIFIISIATMIIGNLFALRQQNIKRFLAFSSIAQVGFILVGLSGQSINGNSSVVYFVLVYMFSNLGAFGVIALVSAATGRENIDDYKGFYKTNPSLSWVLAISLFSLAGIPPMAGFFGKFFLLIAGAGKNNYILITVAALNMVIALFYYLKVIKSIFMDANERPLDRIKSSWHPSIAMAICVAGILLTGMTSGAYNYIYSLFSQ